MPSRFSVSFLSLLSFVPCYSRAANDKEPLNPQEIAALEKFKQPATPPLSAEDELATISVMDGFRLELAAAEPLVTAPVTSTFDEQGRLWVVEMNGYMPNADGTHEDEANGNIVILEDTDKDGKFDKRTVFLDKLVMPRAVSIVKGGILYAAPPELWFVENNGDKPGKKTLVDPKYCGTGNPEHLANGLVMGLENGILNAGGGKTYRMKDGAWTMEPSIGRGQWGICQDDWGRLFYNNNSNQLMCDEAPAGWLTRNPKFIPTRGSGQSVSPNQELYLKRPTPGVNRAYMLDDQGRLKSFTGACGPVIYRGDLFPKEYQGNAFVCEPVANIIRRLILTEVNGKVTGVPASKEREFLSSTDERFRPVSLCNGPDGSIYVTDMYRGIIQHKAFLTRFLKTQYLERGLEKPLNAGRIWRLVPGNKPVSQPAVNLANASIPDLVRTLEHPNGWWRDTAQRLLVQKAEATSVPLLEQRLAESKLPQARVQALWTLNGMNALSLAAASQALKSTDSQLVSHAIRASMPLLEKNDSTALQEEILSLATHQSAAVRFSVALVAAKFPQPKGMETAMALLKNPKSDELIKSAVLSSLGAHLPEYTALLREQPALVKLAQKPSSAKPTRKVEGADKKRWENGAKFYASICMGCHQPGGEGFVGIAPPLQKSEWVQGNPQILGRIILSGLQGPVKVNGKMYQSPDIMPVMPGHQAMPELDDATLADLMTYLRNTFTNNAPPVTIEEGQTARKAAMEHPAPFTPEELKASK